MSQSIESTYSSVLVYSESPNSPPLSIESLSTVCPILLWSISVLVQIKYTYKSVGVYKESTCSVPVYRSTSAILPQSKESPCAIQSQFIGSLPVIMVIYTFHAQFCSLLQENICSYVLVCRQSTYRSVCHPMFYSMSCMEGTNTLEHIFFWVFLALKRLCFLVFWFHYYICYLCCFPISPFCKSDDESQRGRVPPLKISQLA